MKKIAAVILVMSLCRTSDSVEAPLTPDNIIGGTVVVTKVVDGSHIVCGDGEFSFKFHLWGVAVESLSSTNGLAARAVLAEMVEGSKVTFMSRLGAKCDKGYRYAWIQATGLICTSINQKMIELGWAKAEEPPPRCLEAFKGGECTMEDLKKTEATARKNKLGIWKTEDAVQPTPRGDVQEAAPQE